MTKKYPGNPAAGPDDSDPGPADLGYASEPLIPGDRDFLDTQPVHGDENLHPPTAEAGPPG